MSLDICHILYVPEKVMNINNKSYSILQNLFILHIKNQRNGQWFHPVALLGSQTAIHRRGTTFVLMGARSIAIG